MELLQIHVKNVSDSVRRATQSAGNFKVNRQEILQHLQAASSGLNKIDTLSLDTSNELAAEEQALQQSRREVLARETYIDAVVKGIENSLERAADPEDLEINLQNIARPYDVGDLVEKQYRKLQDRAEQFSNSNTRLQQDCEKLSKELGSVKKDLRIQRQARQKAESEQTKLAKDNVGAKAQLSTVQDELQREKDYGQTIKKKRDSAIAAAEALKADLDASRAEDDYHKKRLREVRIEKQGLATANKELEEANATLRTNLRTQEEQLKKAQATPSKMLLTVKSLEKDLRAAKDASALLKTSLNTTRTERCDLVKANKDLTAELSASKSSILAQVECVQKVRAEKTRLATDLKARVDAVEAELRVQMERTQRVEKEKDELVKEHQVNLQAAQAQEELLRNQCPPIFEKRLKEVSALYEGALAGLKQAVAEKDDLMDTNKELDTEVKTLQQALEEEKFSRQRRVSEHKILLETEFVKHEGIAEGLRQRLRELRAQLDNKTKDYEERLQSTASEHKITLEAKSAEHESIVSDLQQHLREQGDQLEDAKKKYEERLQNQETDYTTTISKLQGEEHAARDQAARKQSELEALRKQFEADQQLMRTLHKVINVKAEQNANLCAMFNASIASYNLVMQDLQKELDSRLTGCPAGTSTRLPGSKEDRLEEESHLPQHLDEVGAQQDMGYHGSHDTRPASPLPSTSRKRGTADLDANNDATPVNSKRPRFDTEVPQDTHRGTISTSELAPNASATAANPASKPTESTHESIAPATTSCIPFAIPDNASEANVDLLLKEHTSKLSLVDKSSRIRSIASGLRKLKLSEMGAAVQTLIPVLHDHADDETRRVLTAPDSLTANFLPVRKELSASEPRERVPATVIVPKPAAVYGPELVWEQPLTLEPKDKVPAKVRVPEPMPAYSPNVRHMELGDIDDSSTRHKVEGLMSLLSATTVRECYEILMANTGDRYATAHALLQKEEREEGKDVGAHLPDSETYLEEPEDDDQAKVLKGMYRKWGRSCGIPTQWRAVLTFRDATRRLRSLYNKVAALGEDPLQYLWGPDGLLTKACEENPRTCMKIENLKRILRDFDREHPPPETSKKKRRGISEGTVDDSMVSTPDGEMNDTELAAFHEEALEILQGSDNVEGNTSLSTPKIILKVKPTEQSR